ncbi:MAG: protein translocase subunit SecF [Dethiobacteria bacterium]|nr:protein translocase subunit SecF [Bacillota bacterium]
MNFDYIGFRRWSFALSGLLIILSIISLLFSGLNLGVDFAGGTIIQLRLPEDFDMEEVREVLAPFNLDGAALQRVGGEAGDEVVIRTVPLTEEERKNVLEAFAEHWKLKNEDILQADNVGATVGRELTHQAFWALALATVAMILYITLRFEFKFAIATIAALLHDVLIVLGFFSLLQLEVNSPFLVAILVIVGYSVNDTIVIIDRIRENLKYKKEKEYAGVVNESIGQSIVRCLNTSLTTFFVLVALFVGFNFFIGGLALRNFVIAMLIGVIVGTYSSIFIASPLWFSWKQWEFNRRRSQLRPARRQ